MMRDLDALVEEALSADERELLKRIGDEPGFFGMAFGLFRGPLWWANLIMLAAQTLLFIAGAYAAWMFFEASEPVAQLRWGLPAAVLLILSAMIKMALLPEVHANRVMRELKRIELQIAHQARSAG